MIVMMIIIIIIINNNNDNLIWCHTNTSYICNSSIIQKTIYLKKPRSPATPCNSCSRAQARPRNALRAGIQEAVSTNVLFSPLTSDRMRGTTVFWRISNKKRNPLRMRQRRWRCRSPGGHRKLPFRCGKVVNSLNSPRTWVNPSSSTGTAERAKGRNLHPKKK